MLFCRVLVGQTRCNITIHLIEYGIRHKNTILFPYFPHIFSVACFFCAAVFALYSGDKREIRKDIISRCLCEYIRPQGPLPQILFLSLARRHEYFFHSSTFISRNKKKGMAQRPLCTHKFPNRSPSPPAKSAPTIGRVKPNRASSSLFCCCVLSNEIQFPDRAREYPVSWTNYVNRTVEEGTAILIAISPWLRTSLYLLGLLLLQLLPGAGKGRWGDFWWWQEHFVPCQTPPPLLAP